MSPVLVAKIRGHEAGAVGERVARRAAHRTPRSKLTWCSGQRGATRTRWVRGVSTRDSRPHMVPLFLDCFALERRDTNL